MAAIDHTDIVFKNGKYMKSTYHYNENDEYVSDLPFEYGRDGNIHTINGKYIYDDIIWYRDEYDRLYERKGIKKIYNRWNLGSIVNRLNWVFHRMDHVCYRKEVGIWKGWNHKLYIYHDPLKQSYASFYTDGTDTYVVLAGYGHHENVYTHFMARGYGDEFEEKMAAEAYHWLCGEVLREIVDSVCECWAVRHPVLNELRELFGRCDEDPLQEATDA